MAIFKVILNIHKPPSKQSYSDEIIVSFKLNLIRNCECCLKLRFSIRMRLCVLLILLVMYDTVN